MALKSYIQRTETVEIPNNEPLVVRGFSLPDIMLVAQRHRSAVEELFEKVSAGELRADSVEEVIADVILQFAPVVGQVIASAAGEPDEWEVATTLPLGVQVDALEKIVHLTFESVGGPEKFMGIIRKFLEEMVPGAVR